MPLKFLLTAVLLAAFIPSASAETLKELFEKADAAFNHQQYEVAADFYKQIIQVAPHFAPAYNGLGTVYQNMPDSDFEAAIENYKRAIAEDPKFIPAYENLGRIYYEDQDFDEAQAYLEKALQINPNSPNAKLSLAWIYLMARAKPIKAIKYFKEVNAVSPMANTYYGLGLAYFSNNQREEAMDMITTLRKMGDDDLAKRLEGSMRESRRVHIQPQPSKAKLKPIPKEEEDEIPSAETEEYPTATEPPKVEAPTEKTGLKVRLRGKLSEI